MSAKVGTTEASRLVELRAQYLQDMETVEKEADYRWYATLVREVKRIDHKLAELAKWAQAA